MRSTLVDIFVGILTILFLLGAIAVLMAQAYQIGARDKVEDLYAQTATVVEIHPANDTVTVRDYNGNLWQFYGTDDWHVGDICSLIFDSKGTEEIKDDVIVSARYSGDLNRKGGKYGS